MLKEQTLYLGKSGDSEDMYVHILDVQDLLEQIFTISKTSQDWHRAEFAIAALNDLVCIATNNATSELSADLMFLAEVCHIRENIYMDTFIRSAEFARGEVRHVS